MNAVSRIAARLLTGCLGILMTLPVPAIAANAVNGQILYMANCAGCHGEEGFSIMEEAPNLARFDMVNRQDDELIQIIESGSGSMPPYVGILNESEILDVVSFLRTLN